MSGCYLQKHGRTSSQTLCVFKPDKMNGFEVQSDADSMLERQERDVLSKLNKNNAKSPSSRHAAGFINR
ncbi:hypothetical protein LSH36_29g10016 [Paralvinella palmiformis]|uniref:Uncharacterized protein n=1 Tax=Paralvinella palmiformis TaxID=53620 RepID=A0AAD9KB01_9ANNE|nr:hypothetical protein LSH36_29g10016 [Paralvinella palmiformis]